MKKFILEFMKRGFIACGGGPIVLAIVYAVLYRYDKLQVLMVNEVTLGILTVTLLAFIAGGINAIYTIERLPLMSAIFIHAIILYFTYVVIYLANDWIKAEVIPLITFTVCFIIGFVIIWGIVYFSTKRSTDRLNKMIAEHRSRN